jgi:hypothetical protein
MGARQRSVEDVPNRSCARQLIQGRCAAAAGFCGNGPWPTRDIVETSSMMTMIALLQESDMLAVNAG